MSKRSFILYFDFLYYFERNGKQISPMAIWAIVNMVNVFFDFPFFLNLEFPSWHAMATHISIAALPPFFPSQGLEFKKPKSF